MSRLQCFDALAGRPVVSDKQDSTEAQEDRKHAFRSSQQGSAQPAASPQRSAPLPYQPSRADFIAAFGSRYLSEEDRPSVRPDPELKTLDITIERFRINGRDQSMVWLTNGQVWRQTGSGELRLDRAGEPPLGARIDRGRFGGYTLVLEENGREVSVRRIR